MPRGLAFRRGLGRNLKAIFCDRTGFGIFASESILDIPHLRAFSGLLGFGKNTQAEVCLRRIGSRHDLQAFNAIGGFVLRVTLRVLARFIELELAYLDYSSRYTAGLAYQGGDHNLLVYTLQSWCLPPSTDQ
jgi:hypothetical protein